MKKIPITAAKSPHMMSARWTVKEKNLVKRRYRAGVSLEDIADEVNQSLRKRAKEEGRHLIPVRTARAVAFQCVGLGLMTQSELSAWDDRQKKQKASDRARKRIPIREGILVRDGGVCVVCNQTEDLEAAHIIPFEDTRTNVACEMVILCRYHHKHFDTGCAKCSEKVFRHMCGHYADYKDRYELEYGTGCHRHAKIVRIGEERSSG